MSQYIQFKNNRGSTDARLMVSIPAMQVMRDLHFSEPNMITNEKHPSMICPYDKENMVVDEKYDSPHVGIMYACPLCGFHDNVVVIDEDKLVEKLKTEKKIWADCGDDQMTICDFHEKMKERCGGIVTRWDGMWIQLMSAQEAIQKLGSKEVETR